VDPIRRQMHELERMLTVRIEEQARENRRLRRLWMGTVVTGALLLGLATALVIVSARHGLPGAVADVWLCESSTTLGFGYVPDRSPPAAPVGDPPGGGPGSQVSVASSHIRTSPSAMPTTMTSVS